MAGSPARDTAGLEYNGPTRGPAMWSSPRLNTASLAQTRSLRKSLRTIEQADRRLEPDAAAPQPRLAHPFFCNLAIPRRFVRGPDYALRAQRGTRLSQASLKLALIVRL